MYAINDSQLIFSVIKEELKNSGEIIVSNLDRLVRLWWHSFGIDS